MSILAENMEPGKVYRFINTERTFLVLKKKNLIKTFGYICFDILSLVKENKGTIQAWYLFPEQLNPQVEEVKS